MNNRRSNRLGDILAPAKPRLALIGFRGVGKSAIARRLAEVWRMPLVSLDEKIEADAHMKIAEIVSVRGWAYFRDLEFAALDEAAVSQHVLVDCGGGVVEEADGVPSARKLSLLKEKFFCIYISMSEERMLARVKSLQRNASRPDLTTEDSPEKLMAIFKRREPLYLEAAHAVVDVSDTNIGESVARIAKMFVGRAQKNRRR